MFDNLFSSFAEGDGQTKEAENNGRATLDLPKGIEKLSPNKFKTQVLGTSKTSWAVLYFVPDYPGISDRLKVLASFADEMKGVLKVRLLPVILMPLLVLLYSINYVSFFFSFFFFLEGVWVGGGVYSQLSCKQFHWLRVSRKNIDLFSTS